LKHYILDANAVLRYLESGPGDGSEKVLAIIEDTKRDAAQVWMSVVNLGEVLYVLMKTVDETTALQTIRSLQQVISIADADMERTTQAAMLKYRYKLDYADSFAAALAMEYNATIVSATPAFEKLERKLKWMKLPRFRG
jgi:predicted nucleic acid-binding protein